MANAPKQTHNKDIDDAASQAVKVIQEASIIAAKKIADAAKEAHEVVSDAAATSVKVLHLKSADDHDLLIELKTRMEGLKTDIKEIRDGTAQRITALEAEKCDKTEVAILRKDLENLSEEIHTTRETRMRKLENKQSNYFVTISIYTILVLAMIGTMLAHIFKTTT